MMSCLTAVAGQTVDLIIITEGGNGNSIVNNGANPAEVALDRPVTFSATVSGDGDDVVEWTVAKVGSPGSSDGAPVGMGIGEKVTYAFGEEGRYWVKASAGQNSEIIYVSVSADIGTDQGEALAYGYGDESAALTAAAAAACTPPSDGDSCAEVTLDLSAAKDAICIHETVSITVNSTCHDPAPGTGTEPWTVTLTISGAISANVTSGSGTTSTSPSGTIVITGENTISVTVTPGSAGTGAISAIAKTVCSEGHHLTAQVEVDVIEIEITGKDSYVPYLGADPIGTLKADEKPTGGTQLWSDPTGRLSFSAPTALTTPIIGIALGVATPKIVYTLGCATCDDTGVVGVWEYEFDPGVTPITASATTEAVAMAAAAAPSYVVCIQETKVIKAKLKAGAAIPAGKYKWTASPNKLGKFNPATGALADVLTTTFTAGKKSGLGKIKLVPVDEDGAVKNEGVILEADLAVVEVGSVSADEPDCFDGNPIVFTAITDPPGYEFPSGCPTWSATAGSFVGGSAGETVVWLSPSGAGGTATIKATSGISSADETVTYVHVELPITGFSIAREDVFSFSASVDPAGYPVTVLGEATPPELGLTITDVAITYENLIDVLAVEAGADMVASGIRFVLRPVEFRVLGLDVELKKWFDDWYGTVTVFDGIFAYELMTDLLSDAAGQQAKNYATASGFNSVIGSQHKALTKVATEQWLIAANPFPGNVTDSLVSESATYTWTVSANLTTTAGVIKMKTSGYPGWPEVPNLSVGSWLTVVNAAGFDLEELDLTAVTTQLDVKASFANWDAIAGLELTSEDSYATYEWLAGITIKMGW